MCRQNSEKPFIWGVTGGIGSGKSYVCRLLAERGWPVFSCDDEAKRLIRHDVQLRRQLTGMIGPLLYASDGTLNKAVMAAFLCTGPQQAAMVNAVVHPRVAEEFKAWVEMQSSSDVVMECALLFEAGFDRLVDRTVHVAASHSTRLRRIMARDGVTAAKAEARMALQMDEADKQRRADCVVNNEDGDETGREVERIFRR